MTFIYLYVYVGICMDAHVGVRGQSQESGFPFHRVGPEDRTRAHRLGSECPFHWVLPPAQKLFLLSSVEFPVCRLTLSLRLELSVCTAQQLFCFGFAWLHLLWDSIQHTASFFSYPDLLLPMAARWLGPFGLPLLVQNSSINRNEACAMVWVS